MTLLYCVQLAWRQLVHRRSRLLAALLGVAFAVLLMFMQLGFRSALFASAVRLHRHLNGQVVMISPHASFLARMKPFSQRHLYQALGAPGVESVHPIYVGLPFFKNLDSGASRSIFMLGLRPGEAVLDIPAVAAQEEVLKRPDYVLFDASSRREFGDVASDVRAGRELYAEVNGRKLRIAGLFDLGTSFGIDGTLITSDLNFLRVYPQRTQGLIDIGLVRLKPGVDAAAVRERLRAELPSGVSVYTKDDYMDWEVRYWARVTPTGFVFAFGAVMGFVVGGVIVYQILFADVSEHLPEYATLKAIGGSDLFLYGVVVCQGVILAALGFLPGLFVANELFDVARQATHLPMELSREVRLLVFSLTVGMCCLAAVVTMRKLQAADPADIF